MTTASDQESFERAFVGVSALLGRREHADAGLSAAGAAARRAARAIAEADRPTRAALLAALLAPLAAALEARRLG